MGAVVRVHTETVALDEGMWCRACFLPSGVRIWFTVAIGVRLTLRSVLRCRSCDGTDIDA